MNIRNYTSADYAAVRRNLEDGNLFWPEVDTPQRLSAKILRDPDSIIVADIGGVVAGNIFFVEDGWEAKISHLAVCKEYRGRGLGGLLLREAERRLVDRGFTEISGMVNDAHEGLKKYYGDVGYSFSKKVFRPIFKRFP